MSTIKQFYQMFSSLKITWKQLQDQVKALLFRKEVIPSSLEEVKTLILSFWNKDGDQKLIHRVLSNKRFSCLYSWSVICKQRQLN
jgi:hypothetical protein